MIGLIIGIGALILAFILVGWYFAVYNSLVMLKNQIEKAWSNIDVLLKQRQDELTKLLETVKGAMKHEKGTLESVIAARNAYASAKTIPEKAKANNMMEGALKSLFAVVESYPALRANENAMQLQTRITDIENQISDRREFYNDSVYTFNTRIEQIPYSIIAGMMRYTKQELFKASEEEKKDVQIKF